MSVLLNTSYLDQSIDKLEFGDKTTFEQQDAKLGHYSVSNPHPGFGKDPNILNEYGHSKFPMWITKPDGSRMIVNNQDEYNREMNMPVPPEKSPEQPQQPANPNNAWS